MKKLVLFLIVLMLFTSGCGSAKNESAADYDGGGDAAVSVESPQAAPEMEEVRDSKGENAANFAGNRKIIKNAEVRLKVEDIEAAAGKIKNKTVALKGYPSNFAVYSEEKNASADISLRVPSAAYETLLSFIVEQGKAEYKREYTNDVTMEYIDLDARVKVLKAEEESLLGLLNKAEKIDDILKIKEQITATRGERESLEGQLKAMSQSVEYATISVTLYKPANSEASVNVENLNIFSRAGHAFVYGFNAMTARVGDLIVVFFGTLPTLVLLGLLIAGVLYLRKRRRPGKKD